MKLQALRLFLRPLVERTMRVLAPALDGRGERGAELGRDQPWGPEQLRRCRTR